jgi:phospholipid/cholesterol/gamma-HCH transport system ATP-binding protein
VIGHGKPADILKESSPQLQQFIRGLPDGPVPFDYPAKPIEEDFLI